MNSISLLGAWGITLGMGGMGSRSQAPEADCEQPIQELRLLRQRGLPNWRTGGCDLLCHD